jgi:UDP-N-acetyl-D-glucosamine/UDP-N-acetyl-D-galactosamine dehydrogenase
MERKVAVVGLGYVGLPLALGFSDKFPGTVGFDINQEKVEAIRAGQDVTNEGLEEVLKNTSLKVTAQPEDLKNSNFFVVGVPTPIDEYKRPNLNPLRSACQTVGKCLSKGAIVVFESTVYPGVTEDICGPILAEHSGLRLGVDFKLGYSPERINPGDKEHTLSSIVKVVSAQDEATLDAVAEVYEAVVAAGVFRAKSIKVAEAAKVIENTQRDLNIALMNELAVIFDRLEIASSDVLEAASTKWNFIKFFPGLVGGHCIGVDPYYLTTKAEQLGYRPQVILAGRRINDGMGKYVAQKLVKLMVHRGIQIKGACVGVLGVTFKENVSDTRNSRVPDIVTELQEFGVKCLVHDPMASPDEIKTEYGISLCNLDDLQNLDGMVFAVLHDWYRQISDSDLAQRLRDQSVFVDVKSAFNKDVLPEGVSYWSL